MINSNFKPIFQLRQFLLAHFDNDLHEIPKEHQRKSQKQSQSASNISHQGSEGVEQHLKNFLKTRKDWKLTDWHILVKTWTDKLKYTCVSTRTYGVVSQRMKSSTSPWTQRQLDFFLESNLGDKLNGWTLKPIFCIRAGREAVSHFNYCLENFLGHWEIIHLKLPVCKISQ